MRIQQIPFPRPCKVESHQFFMEGICLDVIHGIALVEGQDGQVRRYNLMEVHWITFTDRTI